MKKVTVIIPVYKAEKYIKRCIESVTAQTYENLEIILIDDDSPDNCPQICDDWAKKDSRIKVLHIENKGAANARNQGLKIATGDYIGFVDSDDYIDNDMYDYLVSLLENNDADISVCSYQVNDADRGDESVSVLDHSDALQWVVTGDYMYGVLWNKLYKRDLVTDIEMPDLKYCEDLVFNYFAFKNAAKVAVGGLKPYHYFQNTGSSIHKNFGISNYDAITARRIILNDVEHLEMDHTEISNNALSSFILSCYVFISRSIRNNICNDLANQARNEIIRYKNNVFKLKSFTVKDKIKTILICVNFNLYKRIAKYVG